VGRPSRRCREALDELGGVKHFAAITWCGRPGNGIRICLPARASGSWSTIPGPVSEGHLEYDPWLWTVGDRARCFTLLDSAGACVPTQDLIPEAASDQMRRILFPVDLPPGGRQIFELRRLLAPRQWASSPISVAGRFWTTAG